jgi:hypothetical protein
MICRFLEYALKAARLAWKRNMVRAAILLTHPVKA